MVDMEPLVTCQSLSLLMNILEQLDTHCDLPKLEGEVGVVFGSLGSLESGEQEAKPKTSKTPRLSNTFFGGTYHFLHGSLLLCLLFLL